MSLYPPPTSNVTVFNPALFQDFNVGGSYGTIGTSGSLAFPVAQGAETFTNGTDTAILDSGSVTLSTIVSLVQSGVELNASGIAYDNGTTIAGATWENLVTKIEAIGAITATSTPVSPPAQSTTLNINDTIQIQNGETATLPHAFISLSADSNNLRMNLSPNGVTNAYGTAGQILTSGGSAGSMTWGSGGGASVGTLNDVLIQGNTTALTATFVSGPETTLIEPIGLTYSNATSNTYIANIITVENTAVTLQSNLDYDKLQILDTVTTELCEVKKNLIELNNTTNGNYITIDNSITPQIQLQDSVLGTASLTSDYLIFNGTTSIVGVKPNATSGLELVTDGALTLDGLGGSAGQVLTYSGGNAVWATPAIRSGVISYSTTITTGAVTFGTPLASTEEPAVTFGMITGANTIFVNIGVVSVTGVAGAWTGFNWRSTSTATTLDVQRAYWIAVPLNL